jgi:hypothetical protein
LEVIIVKKKRELLLFVERLWWVGSAILMLFVLSGCGSSNADETLPFTTIMQQPQLRNFAYFKRQPEILVFTNPQEADSLSQQLADTQPSEQLRQIDYQRNFAILVLQGQKGGQSTITIQRIIRRGDRVIVYAQFVSPDPGQGMTADVTDAYHLVAVPKEGTWGKEIRFELVDADSLFGTAVAETVHLIP